MNELYTYIVQMETKGDIVMQYPFSCQAEDPNHAIEQALDDPWTTEDSWTAVYKLVKENENEG